MQLQEGDIKLIDTEDGVDIELVNGVIGMTAGFESAVYLSLFGCESETWMNEFFNESEKLECKGYNFIKTNPITVQNLRLAESYFASDLDWFKKNLIADKVNVSIILEDRNRIKIQIDIMKNNETLYSNEYAVNWLYSSGALNGN